MLLRRPDIDAQRMETRLLLRLSRTDDTLVGAKGWESFPNSEAIYLMISMLHLPMRRRGSMTPALGEASRPWVSRMTISSASS